MKGRALLVFFGLVMAVYSCSEEVLELPAFTLHTPGGKSGAFAGDSIALQCIAQMQEVPVEFSMYRLRLQPLNAAELPDSVPGELTFLREGALWVSESGQYSLPLSTALPLPANISPGGYLLEASLALINGRQITDTLRFHIRNRQDTIPPEYDFLQSPPVGIALGDTLNAVMEFSDIQSNNLPGAVWRIDVLWRIGTQRVERRTTWPQNPFNLSLAMPEGVSSQSTMLWFQLTDAFGNRLADSVTVIIF